MMRGKERSAQINPWLVAVIVSIATFMEVLDTTITNVALAHIAGSLAASAEESTWVLTAYLVSNAIILPLSGWLSNVIGQKKFFLLCICGFTAASFACGVATSLPMLILFRLLQGIAGGGLQPTQQAIILDAFPPEKRGAVFGITGITLIAAPIIGPTLGGLITDNLSWRWIFFINIPIGIIAYALVKYLVNEPTHARAQGVKKIDYIGLGLVAIGLGALQIMLDKGQQEDWFASNFIIAMALISASALIYGVIWLLKQNDPIIDLRLLKEPSFAFGCILMFFTGFILYGGSVLLPYLVQSQYGYDATLSGLILSPGGIVVMFLMPVGGLLMSKIPAKNMIIFGLLCTFGGMLFTSFLTPQINYSTFVLMRITQVIGLPFLFIPIGILAYMKIPQEKNNKASAIFSLARNLGGSVGIAVLITYVVRNTQIHQAYLAAHFNHSMPNIALVLQNATRAYIDHGINQTSAHMQTLSHYYAELITQANILSFQDAYRFTAAICVGLLIIAFFLPYNKPQSRNAQSGEIH